MWINGLSCRPSLSLNLVFGIPLPTVVLPISSFISSPLTSPHLSPSSQSIPSQPSTFTLISISHLPPYLHYTIMSNLTCSLPSSYLTSYSPISFPPPHPSSPCSLSSLSSKNSYTFTFSFSAACATSLSEMLSLRGAS